MKNILCQHCKSKSITKSGLKYLKNQTIQRYRCKSCGKYFSDKKLKYKTYKPKIILSSISTYNLGYTLEQTKKIIAQRFKTRAGLTTIHSWIKQYSNICTFNRIRSQAIKIYKPKEIIFKKPLKHNQIYKFQLHKAKLQLLSKELLKQKFQLLKLYLNKIPTNKFPHHIFQPKKEKLKELSRSSQMKFQTYKFTKLEKKNLANTLASLALNLARTNRERHEAVQNFMLINDSTTIATEVPVYLTNDDIEYFKKRNFKINLENYYTPITGHIDLLQIRNHLIHILDYKPDANKVNAINQLTIYALALASRTKLAVKDFKAAWFDENNYYEFFPLHAVYPKR